MTIEKPVFKFALREDIKDDKRFLPTRAHSTDSGWDVRAAQEDRKPLIVKPFEYVKVPLGFRSFCPDGWWYELKPRSSTFAKKHLHTLYGTVDFSFEGSLILSAQYIPPLRLGQLATYKGEEAFAFDKSGMQTLTIEFGDAIGQLIPVKRKEMEVVDIGNEEYDRLCKERGGLRGSGGFGSTG